MQIYRDHEAIIRLAYTEDALGLHALVRDRLPAENSTDSQDLAGLMHVVVMESQDTPKHLEQQLGFSVLLNRWNGLGCDHTDFTPSWDALEVYEHWYVLTFILSDDGFGIVVFMPRGVHGTTNDLSILCDRFAQQGSHP